MALNFLKRKKKSHGLYFALVVADAPLDKAQFTIPTDCKYFVTTGDVEPHDVIPRTVLREIVERLTKPAPIPGDTKIAEKHS